MNKKHLLASLILFFALLFVITTNTMSQTPQYYNLNTGTSSNSFPFNVAGGKAINTIFLAGEFNQPNPLPAGQQITKVYFRTSTTGSRTYTNLHILLAQDTIITLTTGQFYAGPWDTVFAKDTTLASTASGWMGVTLQTPFPYDPTKSLILFVGHCGATGTGGSVYNSTLTPVRRTWSIGGCPFAPYSTGGDASMLNFGVDVEPAAPPVSCNFVWSTQTSGVTTALSTVEAVSDLVGWAAGASGVVRRTTDGGLTWTAASTTGQINGAIYCMDALDANTAFVSSSPSATYIYKTSNGGANWTQVFTQAGGFIDGIQMINANTGYALGDPVGGVWTLVTTTNGGVNWTQMPSAPAQVGSEAGWNNAFQIEGTNMWFGTNNTKVYRSTNLGLNWSAGTTTGQLNSYAVHFNSTTLGINSGTLVQKSTDGGATWTNTAGTVGGTGNMLGAEGYGTDYFWVVRGTGIYYTSNGGTSWQTVPGITPAGTMNAIDFAIVGGCPTGWVVASNGNIYAMKIITGVSNNNNEIPSNYSLSQNYPNPFNPSTKISFALPKAGNVKLVVFDLLGREVATLVNDFQTAGNHTVDFNAANLSSGVYFYRIEAGDFKATNKMLLVK